MVRRILILVALLYACSSLPPPGSNATPEQASVVLLRATLADDQSGLDYFPACGGVAVAPDRIITAAHCVPEPVALTVDFEQWSSTASAKSAATLAETSGALAWLRPALPMVAWSRTGPPTDGAALLIRRFERTEVQLSGAHLDVPLEHGDSGSGLFQAGALVGVVESCDSPDGNTCLATGGRFTAVAP